MEMLKGGWKKLKKKESKKGEISWAFWSPFDCYRIF